MKNHKFLFFVLLLLSCCVIVRGYFYVRVNHIVVDNRGSKNPIEDARTLRGMLERGLLTAYQQERALEWAMQHIHSEARSGFSFLIQDIIDRQEINSQTAKEFFRSILIPQFISRKVYRNDLPVNICFFYDYPSMQFKEYEIDMEERITPGSGDSWKAGGIPSGKRLMEAYPDRIKPIKANVYEVTAEYRFTVWKKKENEVFLFITDEVPIRFAVDSPENADQIEYVTSGELDREMRSCFDTTRGSFNALGSFTTPSGYKMGLDFYFCLYYEHLPENIAFRGVFRNYDGYEYPMNPQKQHSYWDWKRDKSSIAGEFPIVPRGMRLEEPGTYAGTVVLIPDATTAFYDPTIHQIWGGILEYPYTFQVSGIDHSYSDESVPKPLR